MRATHKVIERHRTSYADPIVVRAGDAIVATSRENIWDGHRWVWTRAHGKEGWMSETLIRKEGDTAVAETDYDAIELTCEVGAELAVSKEMLGWAWCTDASEQSGWVPLRCLAPRGA